MKRYLEKVEQVYSILQDKQKAAKELGLSLETLNRYLRSLRKAKEQKTETNVKQSAKILLLDIETAPIKAYVWGLWKQDINPIQVIDDWFIIGWAGKWLFEDKIFSEYLKPSDIKKAQDKPLLSPIWKLLDEADIVVAHNGNKFDVPRINTRMLLYGFMPPSPYQVIDTLYYYRKQFSISSNKLDYINQLLLLPTKIETGGFQLWKDCLDGKQEALDKMKKYNINDVLILEENYLRIRPWIKNHPNIGLFVDNNKLTCSNCGSTNLVKANSNYTTTVNSYETYRCKDCGAIAGRLRKSSITQEQKKNILAPIAR